MCLHCTPQSSNKIQAILGYFGESQTESEPQTHPRMLFLVTYIVSRGAETNAVVTSVVTVVAWQLIGGLEEVGCRKRMSSKKWFNHQTREIMVKHVKQV